MEKDVIYVIKKAINESHEIAMNNPGELIKIRDSTIKELVNYGIPNHKMMVRKGHLRETLLTENEAIQLGYSIKNKHFHGLGVKKYFEIIDSLDNPIACYQFTGIGKYDKNNFIILTSVNIGNNKAIVPIEINNKGTYNNIDIVYNRIKTTYAKDDTNYINNMINKSELIE